MGINDMKIYSSRVSPGFYVDGISNIPDDAQEISVELWRELLEGQAEGKIIDFTNVPPALVEYVKTPEDEAAEAESKKAELRLIADTAIAPLEDAVELGIATDGEQTRLSEWRKFRVMLNRVNTSQAPDISWPVLPDN
ncbi:TPA: tail fiber assembly protein [Citrobacter koseri]|uniref:Tail fiber assembly protein n=2 Tax=Citrobacter koseri TaxID=545 RepID=A0AAW4EDD2_CITKO|nr:tail fiber assembly protein [Citrobacter koseri]MBJ8783340.1 tail fiber assembly protein [Citrobacter koseri]MBJ8792624.1 tail fiber assembly protein [Citrobacter koseri]MBJ8862206.1 tail fiber assembly protein [Citrobacter koseri]MBJ9004819.1 tail fiber assembly protein [Citrobacter koseri]MBJ9867697.1 tail fiber assembly protein [Citrobacter koseri]